MSTSQKSRLFKEQLLSWFKMNGRPFNWRQSQNPFHILVAELLLRKTQADRVAEVFDEFCRKYQKPQDVLKTEPLELDRSLSSLGLRRRIGWLRETCKQLVNDYQGTVPDTYEKLCALKGVGPYTANMVLCLGYGRDCIPVDNNVARVISRVFRVKRFRDTRKEREVEAVLDNIKSLDTSRDITLAMLDLSALNCRASKPHCTDCPLISVCEYAKDHGQQ